MTLTITSCSASASGTNSCNPGARVGGAGVRDQVIHQVVDQVVAVLGENRLGVELDAAEVRPQDQVDVAGLGVGLNLNPVGQRAAGAADEGAAEANLLGAAVDADSRLRALEDNVPEAEVDAEPVAQHLMARQPRAGT